MANINVQARKKVHGDDLLRVIESFGKLDWAVFCPSVEEDDVFEEVAKNPHSTLWRWKNIDPELDRLIVEAVESFRGEAEWAISSRERKPRLGGRNYCIRTSKEEQLSKELKDLNYVEIEELIVEKEPEIGIKSNQDVPKLAEHIKRYVEENRQSANNSPAAKTEPTRPQTTEYDLSNFSPYVYPPKPDHIIPTGIEGLLTVYFAKDYDELVEQYGKMRLITQIVAKYKEDQHYAYVKDCLNEVERLVNKQHNEKYLRDLIVNQYGVKIPISKLGGAYQIFLERLHEELLGKRIYT